MNRRQKANTNQKLLIVPLTIALASSIVFFSTPKSVSSVFPDNYPSPRPTPTMQPKPSSSPKVKPSPSLEPSPSISPSPEISPSPTPMVSPSTQPSPEIEPSPSPTVEPSSTPTTNSESSPNPSPSSSPSIGSGVTTSVQSATVEIKPTQTLGASTLAKTGTMNESFGQTLLLTGFFQLILTLYGFKKTQNRFKKA